MIQLDMKKSLLLFGIAGCICTQEPVSAQGEVKPFFSKANIQPNIDSACETLLTEIESGKIEKFEQLGIENLTKKDQQFVLNILGKLLDKRGADQTSKTLILRARINYQLERFGDVNKYVISERIHTSLIGDRLRKEVDSGKIEEFEQLGIENLKEKDQKYVLGKLHWHLTDQMYILRADNRGHEVTNKKLILQARIADYQKQFNRFKLMDFLTVTVKSILILMEVLSLVIGLYVLYKVHINGYQLILIPKNQC